MGTTRTSDATDNSGSTERRTFLKLLVNCVARLVCVAALGWFGLIVANTVGSFRTVGNSVESDDQTNVAIPDLLVPEPGHWTFPNTDLSTEKISCTEHELARRMKSLQSLGDLPLDTNRDASHLVELARLNGATQSSCDSGMAWTFADDHIQLCLVTTDSKTPQLQAAAFAMKEAERWQLTILKPRPFRTAHLLPIPNKPTTKSISNAAPAESETVCARLNEAGELQMELVSTSISGEQLLDHWKHCGWEIRHTPWGSAESFSYLCAQAEEVVYVWSESMTGSRTLMLVRSSGSSKNTAAKSRLKPKLQTFATVNAASKPILN